MAITPEERERVESEVKRYAKDLNLTDQQRERLESALLDTQEKIGQYLKKYPDAPPAEIIDAVNEHRAEIRQRVVNFLSPDQLMKWDTDSLQHRLVMLAGSPRNPLPGPDDGGA